MGTEKVKGIEYYYTISIMQLKKRLDAGEKISCKTWNKIAKENQYLSTESMKYIADRNFDRICREIEEIIENL